jgi:predicted nucleotidyltransferase
MRTLTDLFLQSLVAQLDNENTVGVVLAGSFARGEGGLYSDVDIRCYVRQAPVNAAEIYTMQYLDGYLVSIYLATLEEEYASLRIPQKAIWAVPGLRQIRILLDKDNLISSLKEAALKFTWEPIQAAADAYVSWNLSGFAEETYKILAGLAERNESKTMNATAGLIHGLATTILVQHGVLIPTENAYIDFAQDTAGRTSGWTRQYRMAIGLDPLPIDEPAFIGRGAAGLRLYCETARLLQNILLPKDAAVVNRIIEIIGEAGY